MGHSVIAAFGILGAVGLVLVILGFYLNLLLCIIGALLVLLFLWPAIGMSLSNIEAERQPLRSYDFLSQFDKQQILDCGCGAGRQAIPLAKQMPNGAFLTGIDIYDSKSISVNSFERVQKNAKIEGVADRTKFMVGSVTKIPFENEKFDVVTCMGVLHEIRNPGDRQKALQEIYRVLKPNGMFYLSELNRLRMIQYMGLFALFCKNAEFWEKQLTNNRFRIISSNVRGSLIELISKKA